MCCACRDPNCANPRPIGCKVSMPQGKKVGLVLIRPVERSPLVLPPLLLYRLEPRFLEGSGLDLQLSEQPGSVSAGLVPDELGNVPEREPPLMVERSHHNADSCLCRLVEILDA